jgi:murein DD-endopeptidase MepM/ murein hydrolase activator NlpD
MKLFWPVRVEDGAYIGQMFGQNLADYSQFGWLGHNGIDFPAPTGTKIYAPISSWISEQTAKTSGYGMRITMRVEVDGKFYRITLGHMNKFATNEDFAYDWNNKSRPVRAGQVVGFVDTTGFATGPHLHMSIQEMTAGGGVINAGNGYGGSFDFLPLLADEKEKPSMGQFVHMFGTEEYGLEYTTDFVTTIVRFSSTSDAKEKLKNIPGALNADGTVNFSSAKEIRL